MTEKPGPVATSWLEHVSNRDVLDELYDDPPSLEELDLIFVRLNREGPQLTLWFHFPRYADHPHERWLEQGYNTVQVQLEFYGVRYLEIRGWELANVVNVGLRPKSTDVLAVQVTGSTTNIAFDCDSDLTISRVSAYLRNVD